MRAFQLSEFAGPTGLQLVELPSPESSDDTVLVSVQAIGVNYPDLLMTQGLHQDSPPLPAVLGCELAGVVIDAPPGCEWAEGDRVAAFVWHGAFAEVARAPLNSIIRIPEGIPFDDAAAMLMNYHTVHFALDYRGRVAKGDSVLVLGAAGGIGTAALQVARGLGAEVIAGVANDEQAAVALAAGASRTLILEKGFAQRVRDLNGGRPIDVVLDPLGDWVFHDALRTLGPNGRILVVGFAAGGIPEVKVNRLLLRNTAVIGVAFGSMLDLEPDLMKMQAKSLNQMMSTGIVRPHIGDRFAFHETPEALAKLSRGEIAGKGVIVV